MSNALAVASVVVKELYRRKDFYVLFVLTAVITLLMGSLNFFNDDKIVRYLKEICLLLIWISALVVAMALLGSVLFAAPSSNATICLLVILGILLLGRHLNKVAVQLAEPMSTVVYLVYFAVPHLELFDVRDLVVHNWDPINWLVCGGATLYAGTYAVFFLFATWLVFRRQPLAR